MGKRPSYPPKSPPRRGGNGNNDNNNRGFATCTTVVQVKSWPEFALLFTSAWVILFALYTHMHLFHYSFQTIELRHFENGVPADLLHARLRPAARKAMEKTTAPTKESHTVNYGDPTPDSDSSDSVDWANTAPATSTDPANAASAADNIPVFYNLFVTSETDAPRVTKIVQEQFNKLLPVHRPVYVNSIGAELPYLKETDRETILLGRYETAAEHVTLKSLWEYCQKPEHAERKVVYLHSKGSFTAKPVNGRLRRFLTAGALSEECAAMTDDQCNICSSRFSPVPHPHTSGNMWLAKCDYVKRLIDPEKFEAAMDGLNYGGGEEFMACDGRGRYSAEHWAHSHPSVKPCDLYSSSRFTWDYDGLPTVKVFKESLELQAAPRFDLQLYIKTNIRYCIGRGASQQFRVNEYRGLYDEVPPKDWWGYDFYPQKDDWWPHRDYGWAQLPEAPRQALIKLGYSRHMWESKHRPHQLHGRLWTELEESDRSVLEERFGYNAPIWNEEVRKEVKDRRRIRRSVDEDKPNVSFDRCDANKPEVTKNRDDLSVAGVAPWYTKTKEDKGDGKTLREYVYEAPTTKRTNNKKRVLIIASVPRDESHLVSLWSELECFTDHVDHVIISAPSWGEPYVKRTIALARKYVPHFAEKRVSIEAKYFLNNRYDVGLWCDAYNSLTPGAYDEYGLVNDSVFALRRFSGVLDNLEHQNLRMTSLSYSHTYKWHKGFGAEEYWVESVYRGFDKKGIQIFNDHSCVADDHPFYCPEEENNKACIINNFEHDLAKEYPCNKVQGLYPADSPEILRPREDWRRTWIKNTRYWRMLVEEMGFPVAKVNEPEQTGQWENYGESKNVWRNDPLLKNCTRFLPWDELVADLDFEMAKPLHKQDWKNLPPDIKALAGDTLGYTEEMWDWAQDSPKLAGKAWHMLPISQQKALEKLECTKLRYNKNMCRHENPEGPHDMR